MSICSLLIQTIFKLNMPRPKLIRKMNNPPHFKGYKPIGVLKEANPVVINFEEYEAIRLSDYEFNGHVEAARIMGISRPTYTRIYESARRKVAQAFVLGKAIVFEGGKVYFDSDWYTCNNCGCWFNHPEKALEIRNCALCDSNDIEQYHEEPHMASHDFICICTKCGFEKLQTKAISCINEICPKCNGKMIKKETQNQTRVNNSNCN